MLGITSERFPRGGALLLAIIGATGSFSTAIAGPIMGWISETYGADRVLAYWALLPVALVAIFGGIYLYDKGRGGYAVEKLPGQAAQSRRGRTPLTTDRIGRLSHPIVQLSLDLTSLDEALDTATIGVDAGVDWLEAGTPLLLAEGLRAVEALRARFPDKPIVADLKTMDGGYLEAEMMAKAGADLVVVMGRAHEATIRRVVDAGRDFGIKVMGDNLAADDRVACARWLERLGVDFIVHHIGYDERNMIHGLSPLDELDTVVAAVSIPVQAVGGLSIEQAIECPAHGAPLVVIGAPLVIDGAAFRAADGDLLPRLKQICERIKACSPSSTTRSSRTR